MATRADIKAREEADRFEDEWLARHLARQSELDTPAKRLAFARKQLEIHCAVRERWFANFVPVQCTLTTKGGKRWTHRTEWIERANGWRRMIDKLAVEVEADGKAK